MPAVVVLIIVLLVVFLVLKSVQDARARPAEGDDDHGSGQGSKRPAWSQRRARHQPASSPPTEIDREALSAHVTKLREAVAQGLISADEAAASVVRHTEGALSEESAHQLLNSNDEAA